MTFFVIAHNSLFFGNNIQKNKHLNVFEGKNCDFPNEKKKGNA